MGIAIIASYSLVLIALGDCVYMGNWGEGSLYLSSLWGAHKISGNINYATGSYMLLNTASGYGVIIEGPSLGNSAR